MNELLQDLVEALREELKQYGEMLALLEHQQKLVVLREGLELLESVAAVDGQAEALRVARQEREQRRRHLAVTLGLHEAIGFKELIPHMPSHYQPLVQALVEENNELLVRVQQRARQNHLLLNRAIELMQRFINTVCPGAGLTTYSEAGVALGGGLTQHSFYEAVG